MEKNRIIAVAAYFSWVVQRKAKQIYRYSTESKKEGEIGLYE